MNIFSYFICIVFIVSSQFGVAQPRNCGSVQYLSDQIQNDPGRATRLQAIERHTSGILNSGHRSIITIPVVVHVVYSNSAENISDAQIQSQITVLNEDFRRLNSDADNTWLQAADSEIEFCLASIDPDGNATNGITRTSTSVSSFNVNNAVKFNSSNGKDAWPSADYLNIWVCDISGNILGYGQFPGGPATTDGIVVDYQYFGTTGTATFPFHLGRTATHEVGHWLNLYHIWGDGGCSVDDNVADTPLSDDPNYGCPIGNQSCNSVDMVQNYMDYSDDACMNLFTAGQRARMRALFQTGGARESLLFSNGCNGTPPPQPTCSDGIQNGSETGVDCGGNECPPCPCNDLTITLTIHLDDYPQETSWTLEDENGNGITSGGPYGFMPKGSTVTDTWCLPEGCYKLTVYDSYGDGICCGYGNGSYQVSDELDMVLLSGGQFDSLEAKDFCIGGDCVTQQININEGWNLISTYVIPDNAGMLTVFQEIDADILVVKNILGQAVFPSLGINTIGNWNSQEGYKVKAYNNTVLSIGCELLDPATPFPLPVDWYIIPFPRTAAMDIDIALGNIAANIVLVKDISGNAYMPGLGINTIGTMEPGKGYYIKMSNPDVLVYPDNTRMGAGSSFTPQKKPVHFKLDKNTGHNATIIIPMDRVNNLETGDEIAVYSQNGMLAGAAVYEGRNMAITVWGDDPETEDRVEGFTKLEKFAFKIWRDGKESEVTFEFEQGDNYYLNNGISTVGKIIRNQENTDNRQSGAKLFPNPVNGTLNIEFSLLSNSRVNLRIYDSRGSEILNLNKFYNAGSHIVSYLTADLQAGMYVCIIQSENYQEIKKFTKVY